MDLPDENREPLSILGSPRDALRWKRNKRVGGRPIDDTYANSNRVSRFFLDIGNRVDRIVSLCSSTGVPVDYWERRGERKEISEEKFLLDRSR